MKRVLFVLAAVLLATPHTAYASRCYSKAEAEAEQGIRIHSELMVIGLNCNHMGQRHGQPLYSMYRQFTATHGDLFAKYETLLMNFFRVNGDKKPEASLNTLRTVFANKISNDAAGIRPDIFCARYSPRVLAASEMSTDDIRKWAATSYGTHPVSYPLCASAGK